MCSSNGSSRKKTSLARDFARHSLTTKRIVAQSFGVSRATLYLKPKQPAKDKDLLGQVLAVLRDHPHYGHRRIALVLRRSRNSVLRILRKYGLRPKRRSRKPRKREDEGNSNSGIPNRIKGVCPIRPNAFWAGDFTHFVHRGLFIYLATVLDLYTREVVGWTVRLHHSTELVLAALDDAKTRRHTTPKIFHTDQGSEYASVDCRMWLLVHHVLPSHSRKSSPWQNGCQEAFYSSFKKELGDINRFAMLDEIIEAIHHQMFYYNNRRIHSALKMPPRRFLERYVERISLAARCRIEASKSASESV